MTPTRAEGQEATWTDIGRRLDRIVAAVLRPGDPGFRAFPGRQLPVRVGFLLRALVDQVGEGSPVLRGEVLQEDDLTALVIDDVEAPALLALVWKGPPSQAIREALCCCRRAFFG
ncbi:hypothetical protein ACFLIM_09680 [Nonomuraea sp. M3C6]|uniref:Uncharacterized protein n=1 Tax=Nonomuraea marmarensis TaxID=3351344 RepID=A0ABW7A8U1_9ACTN